MADGHAKPNHDYHLVPPSPWPILASLFAFITAVGAIFWMKHLEIGGLKLGGMMFGGGLIGLLSIFGFWWTDVVREGEEGDHTLVVQISLRYGMALFIASEVMFFVAWFWAFFDASLFTNEVDPICACRLHRRTLAAQGHRGDRSVAFAADQHHDPADLRHHRHLGASRAAAMTTARA